MPRRYLALLLLWLAPQVHAEALYRVELILFRHATPLEASQNAPYDWTRQARPLEGRAERQPALEQRVGGLHPSEAVPTIGHQGLSGKQAALTSSCGSADLQQYVRNGPTVPK